MTETVTLSLRTKLFLSFGMAIGITGAMAAGMGLHFISGRIFAEMQGKAMRDMNSAREVYNRAMDDVRNAVRLSSDRFFVKEALLGRNHASAGRQLDKIKQGESLDMLALVGRSGKVVYCAGNAGLRGRSLFENPLIRKALNSGNEAFANLILSQGDLAAFDQALLARAHIRFVPTKMAKATEKTEETSGLVLAAAGPVLDDSGGLLGVLFAGRLLNRNNDIVDKAKKILYGDSQYKGRSAGSVTLFQGDLRIATTVLDERGERAIGTRISQEVADTVLGQGRTYIGRAFVVNDWYLTAYEPIRDALGGIVGILYVGILERPYADLRKEVCTAFLGIVLLGIILVSALSYVLSGVILGPVAKLTAGAVQLGKGDLSYRVEVDRRDELGELARTFNLMADSIHERDEQIRRQAQETIKETERLATIGRLAAGVAHEINNPLGGILVYTHLLLEDTPAGDPRRENLEKVARETERVRDIVKGLLEFARQTEPRIEDADLNELAAKTLDFIGRQILFDDIRVVKEFDPALPLLSMDRDRIRQVLLNVIMNAAEAMEGRGGTLKVSTRSLDGGSRAEISVSDTGCGISPENLQRVFEPFFTTKDVGRGTGLGLAISYGIVKKHGGTIGLKSEPGKGTDVTILLPRDAGARADAPAD